MPGSTAGSAFPPASIICFPGRLGGFADQKTRRVAGQRCRDRPEIDPMPDQVERKLRSLGEQLPGRVFRPGEDGYAAATAIWANPVGPLPRAVAHCRTTEDVQLAIRAARDCGLPLSVRGGGHHWAGRALCGGLVIDLSGMNRVSVRWPPPVRARLRWHWVPMRSRWVFACSRASRPMPTGVQGPGHCCERRGYCSPSDFRPGIPRCVDSRIAQPYRAGLGTA